MNIWYVLTSVCTPLGIMASWDMSLFGGNQQLYRPYVTRSTSFTNPGLTSWAKICRPFGAFLRPYTKKKKAARPTKNSVPPTIHNSYDQSEVICCAGKNTSAIPRIVVRNPLRPATNMVVLLYWPFGVDSVTANFTSA